MTSQKPHWKFSQAKYLDTQEMPQRDDIKAMISNPYHWPGPTDQQNKTDKFLSVYGVMYVIVNSRKYKGKGVNEHVLKDIVPRGFDARIKEIQGKHQQAIEDKDAAIALLNDDLQKTVTTKYRLSNMKTWHCKHKEMCIKPS